jgi:hypothetical protein
VTGADLRFLHWRLEYVGRCTAEGDPLYWIVTSDNLWVLSSCEQIGYGEWEGFRFASLYPYEEEKKRRNDSTPAQWNIFFADPTGRWGLQLPPNVSEESEHFLFWNPRTSCFLGPHWDRTSFKMYGVSAQGIGGQFYYVYNGYLAQESRFGFTRVVVMNFPGGRASLEKYSSGLEKSSPGSPALRFFCWLIQPS